MNRQEATRVLREVLNGCADYINMDFVSLTDETHQIRMKSTGYEIYIKCAPCVGLTKCLTSILEKHHLKLAQLKDAIVIYKPKED